MNRPNWDQYFIEMLDIVAKRATCDRGKSACIITIENRIISTGYVGSPKGMKHCDEVGHLLKKITHNDGTTSEHCMRTIHAEQNAILQSAKNGVPLKGATLYCTMEPCRNCAMMIISVGITRVVTKFEYQKAQETREMFKEVGVELFVLNKELIKY